MAPTEATRYELSARLFRCPFTLYLTDNPSPATPHRIRAPYSRFETHPVIPYPSPSPSTPDPTPTPPPPPLPLSTATHFPLKDIALYNLASATGDTVEPLFDTIWRSWYPRRNLHPAVDGCAEGFFCRAFRLCVGDARRGGVGGGEEREGVLRALMGFHGGLVRGVEGVLRGVREGRGRGKRVGGEDLGLDLEVRWGLLESFREVVVVVDRREWEGEGVLVVVRGDRVGKFGVEGRGADLVCEFELGEEGGDDEGGMGTGTCHRWLAYRMGLEDAVKTIICDPERKKALAPTVEYYREKSFGF